MPARKGARTWSFSSPWIPGLASCARNGCVINLARVVRLLRAARVILSLTQKLITGFGTPMLVTVLVSCGGTTPYSPTPAESPSSPATPVALKLEVHESTCCNRNSSHLERPWVAYSYCRSLTNSSASVTFTYAARMTVYGADGTGYVTSQDESQVLAPMHTSFGCGGHVRDYDTSHKLGVKYAYRVDYVGSDGTRGSLEGEAPLRISTPEVTGIVINEFRPKGPAGDQDQFIELKNVSPTPINIKGWYINFWNGGAESGRVSSIDDSVTLNPGCHYLLTASPPYGTYSGSTQRDAYMFGYMTDTGTFALRAFSGQIVDQVGMGADTPFKEGDPLGQYGGGSADYSYQRVGPDTNNNAADFRLAPSTPRNSKTC